jgi:glucuronate isomerase
MEKLGNSAHLKITSVEHILKALAIRLEAFVAAGCRATDHGLMMIPYVIKSDSEIEEIFQRRMNGGTLSSQEIEAFQTKILLFLGKEYSKHNIVMQLHLNAIRNLNPPQFKSIGPDTGYDASHDLMVAEKLGLFLGALESEHSLPKTVLYSLNPKDYYSMGTIMGSFQGDAIAGKMQLGSGWWFCDHKEGMVQQLTTLGNIGSLATFIGMLTDSRSFLSYPRHEYFRRILASVIGNWVENGEFPNDPILLDSIVRDICYRNAATYFSFTE